MTNDSSSQPNTRSSHQLDSDALARTRCTAVGTAALGRGPSRRGPLAAICLLGGAALVTFGIIGRSLLQMMCRSGRGKCVPQGTASFRDEGIPAAQKPQDEIDEAMMESFPASDPPASYHSTVTAEV